MNEMLFSIVIPAYNASASIAATLDCVAAQRYRRFEVIIVDDKSDDAAELAELVTSARYAGLDITLELSQEKLNGAGARNRGVELARGDYIAYLDADDEWHPDKLLECQRLINQLVSQGRQKIILYSQVNIIQDGRFLKVMPLQPVARGESVAEYLFGCYGFIQTSTLVLKREDAQLISFDPQFIRHQDYDFCIRADRLGYAFVMMARPLTSYHLVSRFGSQHKGESASYSLFWLAAMQPYLSPRDIDTYRAFKLPLRYRMDGRPLRAALTFARYFLRTNRQNRADFLARLKNKLLAQGGGR